MSENRTTLRVECWLREEVSITEYERQQAVVERLTELEAADQIDRLVVRTWGTQVLHPADSGRRDDSDRPAWEVFRRFEEWAAERGYTLTPGFQRRTRRSPLSEETYETIDLPVFSLAVYEDQQLRAVAPCSMTEAVWTVENCLGMLEADQPERLEVGLA